jgi:hypothetical protein
MNLSPLAQAIYAILQPRVPSWTPEIAYEDLVARLPPLPPPYDDIDVRDPRLSDALGEIVVACRAKKLPALPAIVVRKDTRMPGIGYYPVAHPAAAGDRVQEALAWGNETLVVKKTPFPVTL